MKKQNKIDAVHTSSPASFRWALAALSLSMLLSSLGTSIANVALPALAQHFGASFREVQWIVLAYLLASTALIVSVGQLGDSLGRRRLLLAGIFLFTTASVFCGFALTLQLMIVARVVQGLGAAAMMALSVAFVGETVPKERTGSAMGLLGAMSAVGTALGPTLGGILISGISWQAVFLVNVPFGILTALLVYSYLPVDQPKPEQGRAAFDGAGTLTLVLTLTAYALAMTVGGGSFGLLNAALMVAAVFATGFFVFTESKVSSPLINLAIFRESSLSARLAMSAIVSTVLMATLITGPYYLSRALGLEMATVGIVMSIGPLAVALSGVPIGQIVDSFGEWRIISFGLAAILTGALLMSVIPLTWGVLGYILPIIVITVGYAMFQTGNNTGVMKDVCPDHRGAISGMLNLSRNLGLITGASLMGALFTFASGANDITTAYPENVASGMRITFAGAAVLIIFALAISFGNRFFSFPITKSVRLKTNSTTL